MKNHIISIFATIATIFITSCELKEYDPAEWAVDPELDLSESGILADANSSSYRVTVYKNYDEFSVMSSNPEWCYPEIDKDTLIINLKANDGTAQRTATVTVSLNRGNKSLSKNLTIYQVGGVWDIVEGTDIRLRWTNEISNSQKAVIENQIRQLVYVEGGTMVLGSQDTDVNGVNYSSAASPYNPVHTVTLSSYYIGKFEVTQEQWAAVMDSSPSRFIGGNLPVENISWEEGQEYVQRLAKLTSLNITLPTVAQWEYAARGGKYSMHYQFAGSNDAYEVAHISNTQSALFSTAAVGSKKPNELGLYDMNGNVAEMCADLYGQISTAAQTDPTGPSIDCFGTQKWHAEMGGSMTLGGVLPLGYLSGFLLTTSNQEKKDSFTGLRIVMKR